jgi:hypothetical protein
MLHGVRIWNTVILKPQLKDGPARTEITGAEWNPPNGASAGGGQDDIPQTLAIISLLFSRATSPESGIPLLNR